MFLFLDLEGIEMFAGPITGLLFYQLFHRVFHRSYREMCFAIQLYQREAQNISIFVAQSKSLSDNRGKLDGMRKR